MIFLFDFSMIFLKIFFLRLFEDFSLLTVNKLFKLIVPQAKLLVVPLMDDVLLFGANGFVGFSGPGGRDGDVGFLSNGNVFGLRPHDGVGDVLGEDGLARHELGNLMKKSKNYKKKKKKKKNRITKNIDNIKKIYI